MNSTRCIVSGRVQGVWFRDTTRRKALELGLSGSARNLPDGSVEVIVYGDEEVISGFKEWLWQGSSHSLVSSVECQTFDGDVAAGFVIG